MNLRKLIDSIGGRKFLAWIVCMALAYVALALDWFEPGNTERITIWVTTIFIGGNIAKSVLGKSQSSASENQPKTGNK